MTDPHAAIEVQAVETTASDNLPAVAEPAPPVVQPTHAPMRRFGEDEVAVIKQVIARDQNLSDAELAVFVAACERSGLDPFQRQIYAVKRKGKITLQTGIDGFRVIAERAEGYAGQVGPYWCGPDGEWRDVWLGSDNPHAAKVGVLRHGFPEPLWAIALWSEFAVTGDQGHMWKKMPSLMLAKCAEAQALRKAFPNDLSGLYTSDEMGQADRSPAPARPSLAVAKPKADEPLTVEAVASFTESLREAKCTKAEVVAMVGQATNGRTTELVEVLGSEFGALRRAKAETIGRRTATGGGAGTAAAEPGLSQADAASGDAPATTGEVAAAPAASPGRKATKPQMGRIMAQVGKWSDDARHSWATRLLGRDVESFTTLTPSEANVLIDALAEAEAQQPTLGDAS